ncbi:hypothetical protein FRB90_000376 [Tulasnella sp. 427]|nr:hypothetical protein FRB90_000376 [Tulasnella sp. 427]
MDLIEQDSRRTTHISELPEDLLLDLFSYLDLLSIISLRQTCSRLNQFTRSRALWWDIIRWLEKLNLFPIHLERPISTYSSSELENLVRRKAKSEINLNRISQYEPPAQILPIPQARLRYLVPGGRWFICGTDDRSGRVLYYDFDDLSKGPRLLLLFDSHEELYELAIEIDKSQAYLTFYFAMTFVSTDRFTTHRAIIVGVKLDDDLQSLTTFLRREFMTRQNTNVVNLNPMYSISLSGDRLLRAVNYRGLCHVLYVYKWRDGSQEDLNDPLVCVPDRQLAHIHSASLLPDGRMIACFRFEVCLYAPASIRSSQITVDLNSDEGDNTALRAVPLWSYTFHPGGAPRTIISPASPSLHFHRGIDCTSYWIQNDKYIYNVLVPNDGALPLEVFDLPFGTDNCVFEWYVDAHRAMRYMPAEEPGQVSVTYITIARAEPLAEFYRFLRLTVPESTASQEDWHASHVDVMTELAVYWSGAECCLDEQSGRILLPFEDLINPTHMQILCLAD